VKCNDEVESTNLHIFPSIIQKKFMYPRETLKFWLICIFWQDMVVSKFFTSASYHILNILWQSWKCSLQTVSQFPRNNKEEAEDTLTRITQTERIANFLRSLNLNFNSRDPFKASHISRVLKYTTFMTKDRTVETRNLCSLIYILQLFIFSSKW